MSYRDLRIYRMAREVAVEIHRMTLNELPKFEMYETGSQIRRSSKSVRSNIVEGYGRRRYKQEYLRFLSFAHASNDETIDHLEELNETGSLNNPALFEALSQKLETLGKSLYRFIQSVEENHQSAKEDPSPYNPQPDNA